MSKIGEAIKSCGMLLGLFVAAVLAFSVVWWLFFEESIPTRQLSSDDISDRWPLTVEPVTVACEPPKKALVIHDGKRYAVNGVARASGYDGIDPLWKEGIDAPKVNIGPITDAALELCPED